MDTRNFGNTQTTGVSAIGGGYLAGATLGRPISTDPTTESASGIRDAICHAEEITAQLHGVISHLESRLDTALTPIPPTPATAAAQNAQTMPPISTVRHRIAQVNQGLVEAVQRLNALRDRVEI